MVGAQSVSSGTRDPRFESSHLQNFLTIDCIEKIIIKKKEAGNVPIKNPTKILCDKTMIELIGSFIAVIVNTFLTLSS